MNQSSNHIIAFGAMLLAYALAVYLLIRDRFAAELDHRLDQELEIAERSIARDAGGRLAWRRVHGPEHEEDQRGEGQRLRNVSWLDVWRADGTLALRRQDAATDSGETPVLPLDTAWTGLRSLELPGEVHLRLLQRRVSLEGEMLLMRAALREERLAAEEERKAREEETADQEQQPSAPPPRLDLYLRLAQLQAPVPTVDLLA